MKHEENILTRMSTDILERQLSQFETWPCLKGVDVARQALGRGGKFVKSYSSNLSVFETLALELQTQYRGQHKNTSSRALQGYGGSDSQQ